VARSEGKAAKRYARALFELCEVAQLEQVSGALREFATTFEQSAELRATLLNPAVPAHERSAVVTDIAQALLPELKVFGNFLNVLLENDRLADTPAIAETFATLVAELKKILKLDILSAFPLGEQERAAILDRVQRDYGSLATVTWGLDPELIGGLLVRSGDLQLDGSVRGALARARESLINA